MMQRIDVKGQSWIIDPSNHFTSGSFAKVYLSSNYPDLVLMIFNKGYQYKYDWLNYIKLVYGQSEWKNNYVLVLPLLKEAGEPPEWYKTLDFMCMYGIDPYLRDPLNINIPIPEEFKFETKKPLTTAVKMLGWLLENVRLSPNLDLWASTLYDFFNTFPQYNSDKYQFDFNKYNIMKDGRRYIITDPIID